MKLIDPNAIYVLWLREMKRYMRAKSRVLGTLVMPLMFLGFLGFGFNGVAIPGMGEGVDYLHFLIPGILGMGLLFTSIFAGISVLWDREFGFLKEIMIAPVSRVSIVLGRIAGGATTSVLQSILILVIAIIAGFSVPSLSGFAVSLLFMVLISSTFIGLGLIFASNMKDMQGFNLIMNFVIFPMFFLSGAVFPLANLPDAIKIISYADPLTYGVDGMRGALVGNSMLPLEVDFVVLSAFALSMVVLGAYFFEKSESV
ncbi:MAG: ABC transporter permease [Candidatus Micrarchaeota archaeon]